MTSPSVAGHAPALRACWHPVAYSAELPAGEPLAADLLGEALVLWRDSAGRRTRSSTSASIAAPRSRSARVEGDEIVCPYHGWRYGADGACTRDPAARRPDPGARQGARDGVHVRRALRDGLGRARGAALGAARRPRARGSPPGRPSTAGRTGGRATRRARSRTSPTSATSRSCIPGLLGDPERPVVPGHEVAHGRPRPPLRDRPARGAGQRGLPGVRQRGRRGARAPQPLRAAPAVHDRAAPRLGRRGGDGLLLRLPARGAGPDDGLSRDRRATTTSSSPTRCCRTSRT